MANFSYTLCSPKSSNEFEQYYQFRWEQLRKPLNLPKGSEKDGLEQQAFHCMALSTVLDNFLIIGIGRIHIEGEKTARIRYMAVEGRYRQKGVGAAIIKQLLVWAEAQNANRCWLNARVDAIPFYKRQGFEIVKENETDLAIQHFLMEKNLLNHKNN